MRVGEGGRDGEGAQGVRNRERFERRRWIAAGGGERRELARALLEEEESRGGSEIGLGRQGWDEVVRYDKAAMARTPRMAGTWARRRSRRATRHTLLHYLETGPGRVKPKI